MWWKLQKFPGQQSDEKVVLQLHRHWFVFFLKILTVLILAGLPSLGVWLWNHSAHWMLADDSLGYALLVMLGSAYALFLWMLLYGFWLDYSLDYFVVTNKRVVDIEQSGLFDRTVAEQLLNRVQDVTHEVKGFWPTIFHYGNVYIQTAGEKERFIFEDVPNPDKVVAAILQNTEKVEPTTSPLAKK